MRRPTQHHTTPAIRSAWAHPYTGVIGLGVFYNDGGEPSTPPTPTPADLAAQSNSKRSAPEPLIDSDTGLAMTQERFAKTMTMERRAGRHAAFREMAEAAGIPFELDTFDVNQFGKMFKEANKARQAQLSEEQRRIEELAEREKAFEAREAATAEREAALARRDRDTSIRAVLVRLGATGADLDDASALLRVPDDADEAAVTEAAEALKERRPVLFGTTPPSTTALPPAPGGAPAGGPPRSAATKDDVQARMNALAEKMGYRTKSDAA
jgi:hypothetical protein